MRRIVTTVLAVVTVWLFMLAAHVRVLVDEKIVAAGENLVLEGWGDLGKSNSAIILCRYFTGTGFSTHMFWYSPDSAYGSDRCQLLQKDQLYSVRR